MQTTLKGVNTLYLTGSILLGTICTALVTASLGFFVNISITAWHFPLSCLLSAGLNYYIAKHYINDVRAFYHSVWIGIMVIAAAFSIAGSLYDVSYDGQSYHQEGIYQLKNGWNPVKQLLPDHVNMALFINHYAKGVEVPQSTIYSLTNHIETAKATNFILIAGVFCLLLSLLLKLNKLSVKKSILLALIITLNPVAVNQLVSTYVDGQLAVLILALLVALIWLYLDASPPNLLLLSSAVILLANIKFTGLVYVIIFIAAFLAWLLFARQWRVLKPVLITAIVSGFIAVVIVGYNPYVINTTQFHHPFYPVMGGKKVDIMSYNTPKSFEGKTSAGKFLTSLFAHTDNVIGDANSTKIPFALNKTDVVNAGKVDVRMAGLGPWFSGILLLSFALLAFVFIKAIKSSALKNFVYVVIVLSLSVAIMPESWWARYIPQFWYLPAFILLASEIIIRGRLKFLKGLIYLAFLINITFTFTGFGWNIVMTALAKDQIARLKAAHRTAIVEWGSAQAIRIRLQENGIPYVEKKLDGILNVENFAHAEGKFVIPASSINTPKSKLVLWAEKLNQ